MMKFAFWDKLFLQVIIHCFFRYKQKIIMMIRKQLVKTQAVATVANYQLPLGD